MKTNAILAFILALNFTNLYALHLNKDTLKEVNLTPIIKSFKKIISNELNKNDCEKQVFIKAASLKVVDNMLKVELRTRIKRQYCTRRAKAKVFEKTGDILLYYSVEVKSDKVILKQVNLNPSTNAFEKHLSDVLSGNSKKIIKDTLHKIIFSKKNKLNDTIKYLSVELTSENKLEIKH